MTSHTFVTRSRQPGSISHNVDVTYKALEAMFHMPTIEAAKELGLCTTTFKKACRMFNIARWPGRKRPPAWRKTLPAHSVGTSPGTPHQDAPYSPWNHETFFAPTMEPTGSVCIGVPMTSPPPAFKKIFAPTSYKESMGSMYIGAPITSPPPAAHSLDTGHMKWMRRTVPSCTGPAAHSPDTGHMKWMRRTVPSCTGPAVRSPDTGHMKWMRQTVPSCAEATADYRDESMGCDFNFMSEIEDV
jgi:hypothetical protein